MYALAFDFDIARLKASYPGPRFNQAYKDVKRVLVARGFTWIQGSVYHLDSDDMATLFLAIQDLKSIGWFGLSIRDIRAYRVEQWSDFTAVVKGGVSS